MKKKAPVAPKVPVIEQPIIEQPIAELPGDDEQTYNEDIRSSEPVTELPDVFWVKNLKGKKLKVNKAYYQANSHKLSVIADA
jgi:hypothetical protein